MSIQLTEEQTEKCVDICEAFYNEALQFSREGEFYRTDRLALMVFMHEFTAKRLKEIIEDAETGQIVSYGVN